MKSNQNPFNFSDKAKNWIFGIHVVVRQTSSLLHQVPISDCFCLLKHLAIRIGNPNLNTNLVQFLILFFTCLLICLPNLQVLIVPKWNKKRGIYVLYEKNAKDDFQRNEYTKYLSFLKQRSIWFKIWHQKSKFPNDNGN